MNDEEYIQHFGVQGMRWGVRRSLQRQGYNKKQIKYMNKEYKKTNEFGQRGAENNKRASKVVSKGGIGIEVANATLTSATSRRAFVKRLPVFTGVPKRKIEAALGRPLKDFDYRNRRKAQKLISKYKNVSIRAIDSSNINNPTIGWKRVDKP